VGALDANAFEAAAKVVREGVRAIGSHVKGTLPFYALISPNELSPRE
jgi:hypothetical protein